MTATKMVMMDTTITKRAVRSYRILWGVSSLLLLLVTSTRCQSSDILTSTAKSSNCTAAMEKVIQAAKFGIEWALEMLDASGKPQTGIKRLATYGLFETEQMTRDSLSVLLVMDDEINSDRESTNGACVGVLGSSRAVTHSSHHHLVPHKTMRFQFSNLFLGNYDQCLEVRTPDAFGTLYCRAHLQVHEVFVDICAPDVCAGEDLTPFVRHYLKQVPDVLATVKDSMCLERHIPLTFEAKVAICILVLILVFVVMGTVYDLVVTQYICEVIRDSSDVRSSASCVVNNGVKNSDGGKVQARKKVMKNTTLNKALLSNKLSGSPSIPMRSAASQRNLGQLLLSFSLRKNTSDLLAPSQSSGDIGCIHGIRFISVVWVVFGHLVGFGGPALENATNYMRKSYSSWFHMPTVLFFIVVDTFFVMSGILLTYKVLRELQTKQPTLDYFKTLYFHRFWRLSPTYFLVLMVYVLLFKYTGDGPFWPQELSACNQSWWKNLLYINNYEDYNSMCAAWTWSLSMEIQFFVISPLVLLPLHYFGTRSLSVPLVMLLSSALISGGFSYMYYLAPRSQLRGGYGDYMTYHYFNPIARIGPYLVGMITGYLLHKTDCKVKLSKIVVAFGWLASIAVILCIYGAVIRHYTKKPLTLEICSLFNGLIHSLWGMAVAWVVFACACGYGGIVNRILSWKGFIPFTAIAYCTYLVHPMVIQYYFLSQRRKVYMNDINYNFAFLGILTASFIVALVLYLLLEAPFTNLEKAIRRMRDKNKKKLHQS